MVFYDTEGDISDIENFKIKVLEFHILDIGTAAYTEFDMNTNILDVYEERPHLLGKQWGYMHSHHRMQTFFSGVDSDNLYESAEFFNYYFSLIVNHSGVYCAKVSMRGKVETTKKQVKTYKRGDGSIYTKVVDTEETEDCVYVYNCNITWEGTELDAKLLQGIRLVKAEKLRLNPPKKHTEKEGINVHDWNKERGKNYHEHKDAFKDFDDDFRSLANKKDRDDQLSFFTEIDPEDEEIEPIPENYLEEIIKAVVGVGMEDETFQEQLSNLSAVNDTWKSELLQEAGDILSEVLQPLYEMKLHEVRNEKEKLLQDLSNKLIGYKPPLTFFEVIKEAFMEEFSV